MCPGFEATASSGQGERDMTDDQFEPREKLELAMLRAEHQKKFQVMIDFIKERVGEGVEFANSVARLVISESGGYYELNDLPEEFAGAVGPGIEQSYISEAEAITLLERAAQAAEEIATTDTRQLQILALYTRRGLIDRKNCYVFNYAPEAGNKIGQSSVGAVQSGVMPLFFKIKVDTSATSIVEALGMNHCILVCIVTSGDRYPLMRIRFDGDRTTDLTAHALSRTIQ